jgi:phage tail sheath gpL-like
MADQPILGYPSAWKGPFQAVELNFAQGASTASGGTRSAIYVGPKLSSAPATVNTVYQMQSEQDAIDLFGAGSFPHRMVRMHFKVNKLHKVYAICYAPSSGAGLGTATATITVAFDSGSNPTAGGTLYFSVGPEEMTVAFNTADTATTIGDAIAAGINAKTWLPCTAANVTGVVTVTAKTGGASSGDGTTGVIRVRASVDVGKNVTVATSGDALGLGTGTAGADGAVTEVTGLTAALAVLDPTRYYYIGCSVWTSTGVAPLKTHLATKNQPNPGLYSRGFTAYTGTQASLTTIANGANVEYRHFAWQENSDHDTAEITAQVLAIHQKYESVFGGFVKDNYRDADWLLKKAYSAADWPTSDNNNDAIVDGIIPIGSDPVGSFMVMSVNSRSKNSAGTIDDFRATETHRVSFMHELADTLIARWSNTYQAFRLMDDPRKADGTIDTQAFIPPKTITPNRAKPFFNNIFTEFYNAGLIQRLPDWEDSLKTNVDPLNPSRLEVGASGRKMDLAHQVTIKLNETTPG